MTEKLVPKLTRLFEPNECRALFYFNPTVKTFIFTLNSPSSEFKFTNTQLDYHLEILLPNITLTDTSKISGETKTLQTTYLELKKLIDKTSSDFILLDLNGKLIN